MYRSKEKKVNAPIPKAYGGAGRWRTDSAARIIMEKYYPLPARRSLNRASSITGTPSSCALANLDPGSAPTNT